MTSRNFSIDHFQSASQDGLSSPIIIKILDNYDISSENAFICYVQQKDHEIHLYYDTSFEDNEFDRTLNSLLSPPQSSEVSLVQQPATDPFEQVNMDSSTDSTAKKVINFGIDLLVISYYIFLCIVV